MLVFNPFAETFLVVRVFNPFLYTILVVQVVQDGKRNGGQEKDLAHPTKKSSDPNMLHDY